MEEELHTQRFMDFQAFKIAHVELPKETKRVEKAHGQIGDVLTRNRIIRTELTELCHENEQLQIKLQGQDKDISCHSETIRKYSE